MILLAPAAWAYVVDTDQSGIYVKTWNPGTIPMLIKLPVSSSPTFTDGSKYATSVQAAMQIWNVQLGVVQFTSQVIDTPKNPPAGTYATTTGDTLNEIVMDSTYAGMSFGEGTLAVTTTYTRGNTRVQSDMVFNSDPIVRDTNGTIYHLTWDSYRGSSSGHGTVVDIRRVAIHELGHTLGLDHSELQAKDAIMYFRIEPTSPDTLLADDIAGGQLLYSSPGFVPANNDLANATAITLTGNSIQLTGTNIAASKQPGEPAHAGSTAPTGHSVWWRWTAPGSGSTTITTLGSNFDTALAVYTGTSVAALTAIASNDDAQNDANGHVRTSTVTFNAVGGSTYSIAVDGFAQSIDGDQFTPTGAITLNLSYAGPLSGTAPVITTQPSSQTVTAGSTVNFSAGASGTPTPTYQWQKGGVNIAGATGNIYSITGVGLGDAGNYTVVATNSAGSATSNVATLTVNPAPVAPAITTQPTNQAVTAGNSVTFTVAANGSPAPSYQWQRKPSGSVTWSNLSNGGTYANTGTATLSVSGTTVAMTGDQFRCVATNSVSSATSNAATLTVTVALPTITTQPVSRTVTAGTSVNFSVVASSSVPLTYQWRKDGVALSGATNTSYSIANVQNTSVGSYTVLVTNSGGSTMSNAAILSLGTIPAGFDVSAYLARYPAVAAVYGNDPYAAWIYYRDQGIYNGEVFDDLFRVEEYLTLYPELFSLFGNDLGGALVHWLTIGRLEGRLGRIPLEFSATGYFSRNPDVAAAVNNDPLLAWSHYWLYGIYEGRAYDDELRVFEYLAINADLTAAFVNDWRQAALHWMRYGRTEGRLGRIPLIFSSTEYLNRNPDVAATWGTNPTTVFLHYWLYGIDEGRNFDDLFRVDEYLARYPDLVALYGADRRGAFKHWVRYGQAEGRLGRNP